MFKDRIKLYVMLLLAVFALDAKLALADDPIVHHTGVAHVESTDDLLAAMRSVETDNAADPPLGDHGHARGPFQIHEDFWEDSGIVGRWQDCDDVAYSERVIVAYWQRYESTAYSHADNQTLALLFHYGPGFRRQGDPDNYWSKIRRRM